MGRASSAEVGRGLPVLCTERAGGEAVFTASAAMWAYASRGVTAEAAREKILQDACANYMVAPEPLCVFRLVWVDPGTPADVPARDLGVFLSSNDGEALFGELYGSEWRSVPREEGFPRLARLTADAERRPIHYATEDLNALLGEIDRAEEKLSEKENASFALRHVRFAVQEGLRTAASLVVLA